MRTMLLLLLALVAVGAEPVVVQIPGNAETNFKPIDVRLPESVAALRAKGGLPYLKAMHDYVIPYEGIGKLGAEEYKKLGQSGPIGEASHHWSIPRNVYVEYTTIPERKGTEPTPEHIKRAEDALARFVHAMKTAALHIKPGQLGKKP